MGRRSITLGIVLVTLAAPGLAHAGGFEYAAPGTRALGRGGAFMARADDPMALGYNPAALAFLPGYQLMLGSHLAFYDACVQRSGSDASGMPHPEVCRGGYPGPSPQLVFTGHPIPELGFGIGLLAPAGVGNGTWGDDDGTMDFNGMRVPTPTRYAVVHEDLLLFHPTIGVGFSPVEWLSLGVSLQWGMAIVAYTNYTSVSGTEDPSEQVRTELHSEDWFIPAILVSAHFVPIDELDIVLSARFSDGIDGRGSLALDNPVLGPQTLQDVRLQAGQPWQFGLAVRYAHRRERRYRNPEEAGRITGRIEDKMQNETFDLELDVVYQHNGQVTDFIVTPPEGNSLMLGALPLPHGWQDQVSVRLGGDWNVLPGQLALRAGAHWESSGINPVYQTQDFIPGMRLGLHAGVTVRIERFDISLAYAHIFQFDETVTDGNYRIVGPYGSEGQCTQGNDPGTYDPSNPVVSRGCYPDGFGAAVNSGTYSAGYNVVSLQARYHFE